MARYEAVLGPNTKQWWAYDNETDQWCDPPTEVLDSLGNTKPHFSTEEELSEQEEKFQKILDEEPDWLSDKRHRYPGSMDI